MERSILTIQDEGVKILFCDTGVRRFQTVTGLGKAITFIHMQCYDMYILRIEKPLTASDKKCRSLCFDMLRCGLL